MATKTTKKAAPKKAAKRTPKKATAKRTAKPKPTAKAKAAPKTTAPKAEAPVKTPKPPRERDPRLPRPGAILHREHQGKAIEIEVLEHGFKFDGKVWRSLSAIAREVTGTTWNGFLWAGLQKRPAKPAPAEPKNGAA